MGSKWGESDQWALAPQIGTTVHLTQQLKTERSTERSKNRKAAFRLGLQFLSLRRDRNLRGETHCPLTWFNLTLSSLPWKSCRNFVEICRAEKSCKAEQFLHSTNVEREARRGSDLLKVTQLVMVRVVFRVLMSLVHWPLFYYISRLLFISLLMFSRMNELLIPKMLIADNCPMLHFYPEASEF